MNEFYGNVVTARLYFKGSLHSEPVDEVGNPDLTKALITATRQIDRLSFQGQRETIDQPLEFPRDVCPGVIPTDIEYGAYELARALLDGVDPQLEFENLAMSNQSVAGVKTAYNTSMPTAHIIAGIPDLTAWNYILPYLRDNQELTILRA